MIFCTGSYGNYSELTGLYWLWKNRLFADVDRQQHYYGLAHYRRLFELSEDDLTRMQDNGVDVVLPYPMPYEKLGNKHFPSYKP